MDQNNPLAVIEKLAKICKDGEKGYKDAAEHAKRSDLKTFFTTQSSERGRFARELQSVLMNLGKTEKKESGTAAGALHRAWIDTKVGLGAGDKSILEWVRKGEDEARDAYRGSDRFPSLPPEVADIVSRQARKYSNSPRPSETKGRACRLIRTVNLSGRRPSRLLPTAKPGILFSKRSLMPLDRTHCYALALGVFTLLATGCNTAANTDLNYKTAINDHFKALPACMWSGAEEVSRPSRNLRRFKD